jgi:putative transposase
MDERWLLRAAAYVELKPVKAGMVEVPWDYRWSSVPAHLSGKDKDGIVAGKSLLELVGDWKSYLTKAQGYGIEALERPERTGRPLGDDRFIELAEKLLSRDLKKKKPGPKGADK